jgi:hypothetical protein
MVQHEVLQLMANCFDGASEAVEDGLVAIPEHHLLPVLKGVVVVLAVMPDRVERVPWLSIASR